MREFNCGEQSARANKWRTVDLGESAVLGRKGQKRMNKLFRGRTTNVLTFVNCRGILLVEDFSSADMWQYPPPCMKIPMIGISPIASRSISGELFSELEPEGSVA